MGERKGRSIFDVNRDYLLALQLARDLELDDAWHERLEEYQRFLTRHTHHLAEHPGALFALGRAFHQQSLVHEEAPGERAPERPWFRCLFPPATDPNPALQRILVGHTDKVTSVALSVDGRHALSGSDDTLRWWDLTTGECRAILQGHTKSVSSVALSVDGRHALSGSNDRTLRWWDLETATCLAVFPMDVGVSSVALSPHDGRTPVAGLDDCQVLFFQLEDQHLTPRRRKKRRPRP
jgi:WD40 repeat protein